MTAYNLGNWLNIASFYMVAGCGATISMKSGEFNLGGEGQIYAGGFAAAIVLAKMAGSPAGLAVPLAILAACLTSAILCFLSALLRKFRNANFLLTSFIISSAVIPLINGLISGPFRGNTGNLLATPFIDKAYRFTKILAPSPLNLSFFAALIICLLSALFLFRSDLGKKTCIYGISREFALYSGFSENRITFSSAILSGGLHGLCGSFIVLGTYYTCHQGFYLGIGWAGLSAAMLSSSNPLFMIFSSLFLAAVTVGINSFTLHHNVGYDLGAIIQALIMFAVSIPFAKIYLSRIRKGGSHASS